MAITPGIAHKPGRAGLNNEYGDILRARHSGGVARPGVVCQEMSEGLGVAWRGVAWLSVK